MQQRIKECLFTTTFPVDFKLTKELLMESLYDYEFEVGLDSSTDETYIRGDIISDCFYRIFHNTYSTEERKYILSGVKDIYLNP